VNELHLRFLASDEWAGYLATELAPWIDTFDLGDALMEIGPGPGRTTDLLRERVASVTAVELDTELAAALAERLDGTNVTVLSRSAADTGLDAASFSSVACFTMLHHVPTAEEQDRLFAEAARVLRPGGVLIAVDSVDSEELRAGHVDDVFNPVDPATLEARLVQAGFTGVSIDTSHRQMRFSATTPV
jgi:SAM-dependent methyltransferase